MSKDSDFDNLFEEARVYVGILHKNDIPWYKAPLPRRFHRCKTWTSGVGIRRCACGAMKVYPYPDWIERNSRRKRRTTS